MVSEEFRNFINAKKSEIHKEFDDFKHSESHLSFLKMQRICEILVSMDESWIVSPSAREIVCFFDEHDFIDTSVFDFPDGDYSHFKKNVLNGYYDSTNVSKATKEDLIRLQKAIDDGRVMY